MKKRLKMIEVSLYDLAGERIDPLCLQIVTNESVHNEDDKVPFKQSHTIQYIRFTGTSEFQQFAKKIAKIARMPKWK